MRKFLKVLLTLVIVLAAVPGFAANFKGFVALENGKSLFIDYIPPQPGQPVLILLNGLTYSTESWDQMMPHLVNRGFGILRYDAMGQGQTLLKYGNNPKLPKIMIEDQAKDLALLIKRLGIKQKVSLAGLSYGGGLALQFTAMFPGMVQHSILMPPFVRPLPKQDAWIRAQIKATRAMFPYNPLTDDQLYDYFLHNFIFSVFPVADPTTLKNPYLLESTYRMSAGIRKMDYMALVPLLPKQSIHLMIAMEDEYIPYSMLDQFWKDIPVENRVSRIDVFGTRHRMPEDIPAFAGAWIVQIMHKNPEISQGRKFEGNAYKGVAHCGSVILKLTN